MDVNVNASLPELQIVSIMSVPPLKVTDPRKFRQVLLSDPSFNTSTIDGCYQICLYYDKMKEEDHDGWHLAGWIVESLAMVLLEHPLLAGRLHRREVGDFEIVSNDSGIRLLEAMYPICLAEFLVLNEKENLEGELVFWKEIDDHFPQFSPLFYVQVTNFECGGYSIGISCSLLLAEVLVVENFLKKWSEIHNKMLPNNEVMKTPMAIFSHPHVKNHDLLPSHIINRTITKKNEVKNLVFKITTEGVDFNQGLWRELAMHCVEGAEKKLHIKMGSDFSLLVKESFEVIKVETCSKGGYSMQGLCLNNQITCTTWNDFGVYEVAFQEGNKPVHVSHWIGSVVNGHVMAFPCSKKNVSAAIVVSPPLQTNINHLH
ncbi:putative taxadien-5-alpha-ol O-acetyltransferase [Lupinus albus]|uniref:Putative taxadien-5-alpha-ol O-acetyltransferase n=1 Tax=Lupinus albus TaxID=3870 RepID=A0A6A4NWK7_LUPAL|nr:putative taxadien-5-alpha-ol O-acetyltransferase [Lupinus albus]